MSSRWIVTLHGTYSLIEILSPPLHRLFKRLSKHDPAQREAGRLNPALGQVQWSFTNLWADDAKKPVTPKDPKAKDPKTKAPKEKKPKDDSMWGNAGDTWGPKSTGP